MNIEIIEKFYNGLDNLPSKNNRKASQVFKNEICNHFNVVKGSAEYIQILHKIYEIDEVEGRKQYLIIEAERVAELQQKEAKILELKNQFKSYRFKNYDDIYDLACLIFESVRRQLLKNNLIRVIGSSVSDSIYFTNLKGIKIRLSDHLNNGMSGLIYKNYDSNIIFDVEFIKKFKTTGDIVYYLIHDHKI